jgi:hypothetical protein
MKLSEPIKGTYNTITIPKYKWEFRYYKKDTMCYMKESAPNLFHRIMQELILGVYWKRIGK